MFKKDLEETVVERVFSFISLIVPLKVNLISQKRTFSLSVRCQRNVITPGEYKNDLVLTFLVTERTIPVDFGSGGCLRVDRKYEVVPVVIRLK